jgi:hypothetical protein
MQINWLDAQGNYLGVYHHTNISSSTGIVGLSQNSEMICWGSGTSPSTGGYNNLGARFAQVYIISQGRNAGSDAYCFINKVVLIPLQAGASITNPSPWVDAGEVVEITGGQITADTVNGNRIIANTLDASKIVAKSINTDRLVLGAANQNVSASYLNAGSYPGNTSYLEASTPTQYISTTVDWSSVINKATGHIRIGRDDVQPVYSMRGDILLEYWLYNPSWGLINTGVLQQLLINESAYGIFGEIDIPFATQTVQSWSICHFGFRLRARITCYGAGYVAMNAMPYLYITAHMYSMEFKI